MRVCYLPKFSLDSGRNWIFEGSTERVLDPIWKLTPILSAPLGYQDSDESKRNIDYLHWDEGVTLEIHQNVDEDFRYHDTTDVPFSCKDLRDAAFVASLTVRCWSLSDVLGTILKARWIQIQRNFSYACTNYFTIARQLGQVLIIPATYLIVGLKPLHCGMPALTGKV